MNLKKCFAAILAAAIVCGNTASFTAGIKYIPDTVIAADETAAPTIWDGTADTTWYDDEETEFHITTAEQLAGIASLVNTSKKYFEGKTIILESDIYMNRAGKAVNKWTPISDFKGTFKGNGHYIFNYYSSANGLIKKSSGDISDLNFVNATVLHAGDETVPVGGICGTSTGSITNCYFQGSSSSDHAQYLGGICGYMSNSESFIKDCVFSGSIVSSYSENIGGICGRSVSMIERCCASGKIGYVYYESKPKTHTYRYVCGICGYYDADAKNPLNNCASSVSIKIEPNSSISEYEDYYTYMYSAGIAGYAKNLSNCYNLGKITNKAGRQNSAGILCGKYEDNPRSISNVYNVGVIDSKFPNGITNFLEKVTFKNNYYLNTSAENGVHLASGDIEGVAAKTEANMKTEKFANTLGEAFEYVPNSYPRLVWETENEHLRLNKNSLKFTKLDTSEQLSLRKSYDGSITWLSTDPSVVSVDKNGVVVPHNNGNALIYAIYDNKKAVCDVTVNVPPAMNKTKMTIRVGDSEKLSVIAGESAFETENLIFKSSNEKIVKVNESGVVTGIAEGECKVTVKVNGTLLTCDVTVTKKTEPATEPADKAELDKTSITLSNGEVTNISVLNYECSVEWLSADSDIVSVEKKSGNIATITARDLGTTTVCALLASGKTLICEVTVKAGKITTTTTNTTTTVTTSETTIATTTTKIPQDALEINADKIILKAGQHFAIIANQADLTYSSSNTDIAIVSANGIVTALKNGEVTISVYNSSFDTVSLRVIVSNNSWGDANCDEQVNMADAVMIMQCLSNPDKYTLSLQGEINADVDGSNDITNKDALRIQQYKLGLLEEII